MNNNRPCVICLDERPSEVLQHLTDKTCPECGKYICSDHSYRFANTAYCLPCRDKVSDAFWKCVETPKPSIQYAPESVGGNTLGLGMFE